MRPLFLALAAFTASCVLLACGGSDKLSTDNAVVVATAVSALATNCADGTEVNAAERGIGTLIRIYRSNPAATYGVGSDNRTMRQVLTDTARDLDSCNRSAAMELRDAR